MMAVMHQSAPFTSEDLASFPDDGYRRELVEGRLLVTPAPGAPHQYSVVELIALLHAAVPAHLLVFTAPADVRLTETTVLQPDVFVVRREDVRGPVFTRPPLLAVEVLSPSTRAVDLTLKRTLYEAHGVLSYWLVDLQVPSLTVLELEDGRYAERAVVHGGESWTAERPFPVTVAPANLVLPLGLQRFRGQGGCGQAAGCAAAVRRSRSASAGVR